MNFLQTGAQYDSTRAKAVRARRRRQAAEFQPESALDPTSDSLMPFEFDKKEPAAPAIVIPPSSNAGTAEAEFGLELSDAKRKGGLGEDWEGLTSGTSSEFEAISELGAIGTRCVELSTDLVRGHKAHVGPSTVIAPDTPIGIASNREEHTVRPSPNAPPYPSLFANTLFPKSPLLQQGVGGMGNGEESDSSTGFNPEAWKRGAQDKRSSRPLAGSPTDKQHMLKIPPLLEEAVDLEGSDEQTGERRGRPRGRSIGTAAWRDDLLASISPAARESARLSHSMAHAPDPDDSTTAYHFRHVAVPSQAILPSGAATVPPASHQSCHSVLSRAAVHTAFLHQAGSIEGEATTEEEGLDALNLIVLSSATDVEFVSSADEGVQRPSVILPSSQRLQPSGQAGYHLATQSLCEGTPLDSTLSQLYTSPRKPHRISQPYAFRRPRGAASLRATSDLGLLTGPTQSRHTRQKPRYRRLRATGSDDDEMRRRAESEGEQVHARDEFLQALENLRAMASFGKPPGSSAAIGPKYKATAGQSNAVARAHANSGSETLLGVGTARQMGAKRAPGTAPSFMFTNDHSSNDEQDLSSPNSPFNSAAGEGDDELSASGIGPSNVMEQNLSPTAQDRESSRSRSQGSKGKNRWYRRSYGGRDQFSNVKEDEQGDRNGRNNASAVGRGWRDWVTGKVTLSGWQILGLAGLILSLGVGAGSLLGRKSLCISPFTFSIR